MVIRTQKEMVSESESSSGSSSGDRDSVTSSPHQRDDENSRSSGSEYSHDNVRSNIEDDKSSLSAVSSGTGTGTGPNSPVTAVKKSDDDNSDNSDGHEVISSDEDSHSDGNINDEATSPIPTNNNGPKKLLESVENKLNNLVDDLSDVSDSESIADDNDDSQLKKYNLQDDSPKFTDKKSTKVLEKKQDEGHLCKKFQDKIGKLDDGEEQLDFELEEGENGTVSNENQQQNAKNNDDSEKKSEASDGELEEGELSDDDEARPEEVEPKPVCKFYSRGLCTWGMSCRFLHPGVMDKGNYTMFDIIRPPVQEAVTKPEERPTSGTNTQSAATAPVETAWERGCRNAKEMVKRANKRKEQDSDFEEKKLTLTHSPEETDKENGFYNRISPEPPVVPSTRHYPPIRSNIPLHIPREYMPQSRFQHDYYNRRLYFDDRPESDIIISRERGGIRTYREVPVNRLPPHPAYYSKYNDQMVMENPMKRHGRSRREVILQRVEPGIKGRVYDYPDPWARNKSPIKDRFSKQGRRKGSYSSGSTYSSSSTTSRSSSLSSRSSYGKSRSKSVSPSRAKTSRRQKSSTPSTKRVSRKHSSPLQSGAKKIDVDQQNSRKQSNKSVKPPSPMRPASRTSTMQQLKVDYDRERDRKKQLGHNRNNLASKTAAPSVTTISAQITAPTTKSVRKHVSSRSSSASGSSSSSSTSGSESSDSSSSSGRRKSPKTLTKRKQDRRVNDVLKKVSSPPPQSLSPPPLQLNPKKTIKLNLKPPNLPSVVPPPSQKKLLIIPDFCMPDESEGQRKKSDGTSSDSLSGKKRPISALSTTPPSVSNSLSGSSNGKEIDNCSDSKSSKAKTSRREELLKQLKAVEDAIAKKRSKLS